MAGASRAAVAELLQCDPSLPRPFGMILGDSRVEERGDADWHCLEHPVIVLEGRSAGLAGSIRHEDVPMRYRHTHGLGR